MAHAYLSYTRSDEQAAQVIRDGFARANISIASDAERGRAGHALPENTRASIANAFAFITVISAASADDPLQRAELERAIEDGLPILPVRLNAAGLSPWWQERIGHLVHVEATGGSVGHVEDLLFAVRRFFNHLCPVVTLMNMKGGVGKTTLTAQVFAALQKARGNRVLLIDLDPQHNLSQLFFRRSTQDTLIYMDASAISLFEPSGLQGEPSPADRWDAVNMANASPPQPDQIARRLIPEGKTQGRFDLVCGQFDIAKYAFLEDRSMIDTARENFICSIDILREHYDLIVLDTNPSASFITRASLSVSTRILAPIRPDRFSLRGVRLLNELITRLLDAPGRPPISLVFNGVERASMTEFEADVRDGKLDASAGFSVSRAALKHRLHASKFLSVRDDGMEDDPLRHLAIYRANGIWAGALKDALSGIADEVAAAVDLPGARPPA